MSFRRGWTHGVLAMAVLPAVLAALMYRWGRSRDARAGSAPLRLKGLLALSYVGTVLHVFMDWLNSYGVRLLKPFSDRWFYGDALYIIDPVLDILFLAAIVLARRAAARGTPAPWRPARIGLGIAAVYMSLMVVSNWWARAEVGAGLERAGRAGHRFMVTPVFANPFRREVIVDLGDRYEKGFLWFDPLPHFRPAGYGVEARWSDPSVIAARQQPRIQAFLMWSRFPFFVVERQNARTRVFVNDYRYSGPGGREGWATQSVDVP
jgi:inner membrane protein